LCFFSCSHFFLKLVLRGFGDPRATTDLILSVRDKTKLRDSSSEEKTFLSIKGIFPAKIFFLLFQESEGLLTEEDWNILLNGASQKVYNKDETILNANIRSTKLFQIVKGSCRVEKGTVLGKMETGEIFGEINFLDGEGTSASVVADEEETEVLVMRRSALKILFVRHPALAGRFYHYLSTILSLRYKEREAAYLDPNI
jgi:CRP-like cAMP-binding protein